MTFLSFSFFLFINHAKYLEISAGGLWKVNTLVFWVFVINFCELRPSGNSNSGNSAR